MTTKPSVARDTRYVLTEQGRRTLDDHVRCACQIKMMGVIFACPDCGTIYGFVKDASQQRTKSYGYR